MVARENKSKAAGTPPASKGITSFFSRVTKEDAEKETIKRHDESRRKAEEAARLKAEEERRLKEAELAELTKGQPITPARHRLSGEKRTASPCNPGSTKAFFHITKESENSKPTTLFEPRFADALRRKQNVNLFISDGRVMFQFNYNTLAIDAIKTHIQGRAWDASRKCWHCPLSSLEDAIALYEHMGRKADKEIKDRAKAIKLAAPSSGLTMTICVPERSFTRIMRVEGALNHESHQGPTLEFPSGVAKVTFTFLPDVVVAIKSAVLPPHRTYDAASKEWRVDLLHLPQLLQALSGLDYTLPDPLKQISALCTSLAACWNSASGSAEDAAGGGEMARLYSDMTQLLYTVTNGPPPSLEDLSGDVGAPKVRRLTYQQLTWREQQAAWSQERDFDHDFGSGCGGHGGYGGSGGRSGAYRPAVGCDCGRPDKLVGGVHQCRYYGTFACKNCGNEWTSAHTWKGATQECRRCDTSNEPVKKEALRGGIGLGGGAGHHDSLRCSQCRRLGDDCSLL